MSGKNRPDHSEYDKTTGKRRPWEHSDYVDALKTLRKSSLFTGFDAASGYDLRKKLTPYRRKQIKKHIRIYNVVKSKPHTYFAPKEPAYFAMVRRILGFHTNKLTKIPFPLLPGAGRPGLYIFPKKGYVSVEYPEKNMRQIVYGIDVNAIVKAVDFNDEETNPKDAVSTAIIDAMRPFIADVDNGSTVFRLHTSSGDINPDGYKPVMDAERMLALVEKLVDAYLERNKNNNLILTGFSAWQRLLPHGRLWTTAEKSSARYDFTAAGRPHKKSGGAKRSAREKAKGRL